MRLFIRGELRVECLFLGLGDEVGLVDDTHCAKSRTIRGGGSICDRTRNGTECTARGEGLALLFVIGQHLVDTGDKHRECVCVSELVVGGQEVFFEVFDSLVRDACADFFVSANAVGLVLRGEEEENGTVFAAGGKVAAEYLSCEGFERSAFPVLDGHGEDADMVRVFDCREFRLEELHIGQRQHSDFVDYAGGSARRT